MAGCNKTIVFPFEDFDMYTFEEMPKGECMRFAVNPYNGKVVLSYQDYGDKARIVEKVIRQVTRDVSAISRMSGNRCGLQEFSKLCEGVINRRDLDYHGLSVVGFDGLGRGSDVRNRIA